MCDIQNNFIHDTITMYVCVMIWYTVVRETFVWDNLVVKIIHCITYMYFCGLAVPTKISYPQIFCTD